jgi:hypothetical protein
MSEENTDKAGKERPQVVEGNRSRIEAVEATRKRFLQLVATSAGASLAGCGYGFVASNAITPDNPLALNMLESQKRFFRFCRLLSVDSTLRSSFIEDPSGTLMSHGLIAPNTRVSISRANKLVFYILANEDLRNDVAAIALKSEGTRKAVTGWGNEFTGNNPNFDAISSITKEVVAAPDYRGVLEKQLYVLLGDAKFCELAGIQLRVDDRRAYAHTLSYQLHQFSPFRPAIVILNANAIANANAIINANAFGNVNVNANANANANANFNWNCNWNTAHGHCPPQNADSWYAFLDDLLEQAQVLEGSAR